VFSLRLPDRYELCRRFPDREVHLAHRFRDMFAVQLLNAGATLETVAVLLGNSVKIVEKHHGPWVQNRQDQLDEALLAAATFNPLLATFPRDRTRKNTHSRK
jgi:hypothetical protein